jgi:acetyltransferase-like isoleucine patch superfamily enzyme
MTAPIISPNIRVRVPDHFDVGEGSVVDDYSYFSTRVRIGRGSHVANNCSIAGGARWLFSLGDFSSVSAGVRIWCSSNDFPNDLIAIASDIGEEPIQGDVLVGDYTGIGANAVVMPNNRIPDGVAVGALSFVPSAFPFDRWTVYAGIPIRAVGGRNRERVLAQARRAAAALPAERR